MNRTRSRLEKIERKIAPGEDVAATLRALSDDEFLAVVSAMTPIDFAGQ
jgi:hypothetical protein